MEWLTLISGAFKAFTEMSKDVKDIASFFRQAQQENWFNKTANDFSPLNGPTTGGQKDAAAKGIADDISAM